jgi:hypothetical protein
MPGPAEVTARTVFGPSGTLPVHTRTFEVNAGAEGLFRIEHTHFTEAHLDRLTVQDILESTRDELLKSTGALLRSENAHLHDGWPALDVAASVGQGDRSAEVAWLIVLVGRERYILTATRASSLNAFRFIGSFSPVPPIEKFRLPNRGIPEYARPSRPVLRVLGL